MEILTINNQNFQKPSRNPCNRTKVKILKKKNFWIAQQKNLVPRLLSHRGMFEHRNSDENRRKRSEIFRKFTKGIKGIDWGQKKNLKLSHACVPLEKHSVWETFTESTILCKTLIKGRYSTVQYNSKNFYISIIDNFYRKTPRHFWRKIMFPLFLRHMTQLPADYSALQYSYGLQASFGTKNIDPNW